MRPPDSEAHASVNTLTPRLLIWSLVALVALGQPLAAQRIDTLPGKLPLERAVFPAATSDTLDTWFSHGGQTTQDRQWIVRSIVRTASGPGDAYVIRVAWHDSTGRQTNVQSSSLDAQSLALRLVVARADRDSASALITADRVVAWVVPAGQPPRFVDQPAHATLVANEVLQALIARQPLEPGRLFAAASLNLYGSGDVESWSILRVARSEAVAVRGEIRACWVIERLRDPAAPPSTTMWVDKESGRALIERGRVGSAGDAWWHAVRGATLPK